MKELDLNFDELAYAFDDPTSGSSYYLDLETGSIILVRPDLEDVGTLRGDIEMEPDRYLFVPGPQTNQFQLDVEDFAFRLTDEKLKSMVELVLSAPNKHASLRAVLQKVPGEWEKWEEWKKQSARQRAMRWLEAHDIKPVRR